MKRPRDENIGTLFRVPNTPEGLAFIEQMRQYAAGGTTVRLRGRGHRVKAAIANGRYRNLWKQSIPLKHADYFAVYINKPVLEQQVRRANSQQYQHIRDLEHRITQITNPEQAMQAMELLKIVIEGFKPKTRRRIEL